MEYQDIGLYMGYSVGIKPSTGMAPEIDQVCVQRFAHELGDALTLIENGVLVDGKADEVRRIKAELLEQAKQELRDEMSGLLNN